MFTIKLVLHFIAVVRGAFDDKHFDIIVNGPRSYSIEAVSIFSQHRCSDKISPKNWPVKGLTNFTDLTLVGLILSYPGKC